MGGNNTDQPLEGKRIVITRPVEQARDFVSCISALGGSPVKFPVIEIRPPDSWSAADNGINRMTDYGWIIFTSVNGVRSFIDRIIERGKDIKKVLAGIRICTIGLKTANAVEQYGPWVDFIPEEFRAESIAEGFRKMGNTGEQVLIPRAQKGRDILPEELAKLGLKVDVIPVYKISRPDTDVSWLKKMLKDKEIDVVTFTSGSCVRNFIEFLGPEEYKILLAGIRIACISPVTADTVRNYGLEVDIIPERYTVDSLAAAIAMYYKR